MRRPCERCERTFDRTLNRSGKLCLICREKAQRDGGRKTAKTVRTQWKKIMKQRNLLGEQ